MGKCLFMRKGETHTAPISYKANFADNTWEQIIDACQKNAVPDTWLVGDQKTMTINGTDYAIDIIGKNHDTYSDGNGKAPLTFQLHDCYETKYAMNSSRTNVGGWESCLMRSTYLPNIFANMPTAVQSGIRNVSKKTSAGGNSSTIKTTADKLFLLSENEVFGTLTYTCAGEGSQYAYYSAGNTRKKTLINNSATLCDWWERSPRYNYTSPTGATEYICSVNGDGDASAEYANNAIYVSFAFCF